MKKKAFIIFALFMILFSVVACGRKQNATTDKPNHEHTYSNEWSYNETSHYHLATCGHDVISSEEKHTFNSGVITKEATDSENGNRLYTCSVCGYKKNEVIPRLEDKSAAGIVSSGNIVFDGLNGKDTVANSEEVYRFNSVITVSPGAKWVLAKDISGSEIFTTKVAPLSEGDNTYYIVVTSGDETKIEVYTVVIRRKPIYTVSFNTNGGSSVSSQFIEEGYNLESVSNSSKAGYTFNGWYIGEEKVELPYVVTKDVELEAKFSANTDTKYVVKHYKQNIDGTYNTIPDDTDNLTGTTDTLTNASLKSYEGFTAPTLTQVNIIGYLPTVITLKYTRNTYAVSTTINNVNAGTITNLSNASYKYGQELTLTATENPGYTFNGWYIGEEKVELPYVVTKDVELEAKFTANKYTVTIDPQGYNYTGETSYEVTYGELFQFPIASGTPTDKVYTTTFNGWKYGGEHITDSNGNLLNNWNIASNITITPELVADDSIYFGSYPQKKVKASSSNGLSTIKFNISTWTDYGYYINGNISSYMYYYDVDVDNNGSYDYRGVYFTSYRPDYTTNSSSESYSYQDDNGYNTNTIYWFKYEPIKWNVLESKDGKALILADLILDSQEYQHYASLDSQFSHNGGTGYANNYELSHIRQWLNDTFYETAFNELEKAIIETTNVDNSPSSTNNGLNYYACANTNDKIFLLSYQEADKYFTSSTFCKTKTTDYAQVQGAYAAQNESILGMGYWWLRSPYFSNYYTIYCVNYAGVIYTDDVESTYFGVRAACWINL